LPHTGDEAVAVTVTTVTAVSEATDDVAEIDTLDVFAVTLTVEDAEPEHDEELTVYVYVPTPASAGLHVPPVAGVPPSAANS
jgi:hypothetical protein